MITKENIKSLVGNHVSPYIYNAKDFTPGKTPIYYSGPYWDGRETEAAIDSFLNENGLLLERKYINLKVNLVKDLIPNIHIWLTQVHQQT